MDSTAAAEARRAAFRAHCAEREAERRERHGRNAAAAVGAGVAVFRSRDRWAVLHPSSRTVGAWQASYFDARGPYTHDEFQSRDDGVLYLSGYRLPYLGLPEQGWEVADAMEFEEVSRGPEFRAPDVR